MKKLSKKEMETLLKSQQGELDGVVMYQALAKAVRNPKDAETFMQLAADEGRHAAVFQKLTGKSLTPNRKKARMLVLLYRILGKKRLYPLIAKGEYAALKTYAPVVKRFPEVASVRADEKRHGDTVMALLK